MKIILIYIVSNHHLRNLDILSNIYKDYELIILHEDNLDILTNLRNLKKNYTNFNISTKKFSNFINFNKNNIFFAFLSTIQIRYPVLKLYKKLILNEIRTVSLQETHQMYLHNENLNNYILPTDLFFVCSKYEKDKYIQYSYDKDKIKVSGWPYKRPSSKSYSNTNKYCLLILNANKKSNPISHETINIQYELINKLVKIIPKNHFLYIKQHPVDFKYNFKFSNKKIKFIKNNNDIQRLILCANYVFSTGFTQAIMETIICNKNMYIIKINNDKNNIFFNIWKENILDLSKKNISLSKKYNSKTFSQFKNINNLNLSYEKISLTINKNIEELLNKKFDINYKKIQLKHLIIWLIYFERKDEIKNIMKYISNNKYFEEIKIIYENLSSLEFREFSLYNIINNNLTSNIFVPIKYIILKKIIKNKINVLNIDKKFLDLLLIKDLKFMRVHFYNDLQVILFYFSSFKNIFYDKLEILDTETNSDLFLSKSNILKFLIILRRKKFIFKSLLMKFIFTIISLKQNY